MLLALERLGIRLWHGDAQSFQARLGVRHKFGERVIPDDAGIVSPGDIAAFGFLEGLAEHHQRTVGVAIQGVTVYQFEQASTGGTNGAFDEVIARDAIVAFGEYFLDIAQTLLLSVRTVEAHLRSIYAKLGVRSRTEAALWAVRHGAGETG